MLVHVLAKLVDFAAFHGFLSWSTLEGANHVSCVHSNTLNQVLTGSPIRFLPIQSSVDEEHDSQVIVVGDENASSVAVISANRTFGCPRCDIVGMILQRWDVNK